MRTFKTLVDILSYDCIFKAGHEVKYDGNEYSIIHNTLDRECFFSKEFVESCPEYFEVKMLTFEQEKEVYTEDEVKKMLEYAFGSATVHTSNKTGQSNGQLIAEIITYYLRPQKIFKKETM